MRHARALPTRHVERRQAQAAAQLEHARRLRQRQDVAPLEERESD